MRPFVPAIWSIILVVPWGWDTELVRNAFSPFQTARCRKPERLQVLFKTEVTFTVKFTCSSSTKRRASTVSRCLTSQCQCNVPKTWYSLRISAQRCRTVTARCMSATPWTQRSLSAGSDRLHASSMADDRCLHIRRATFLSCGGRPSVDRVDFKRLTC